MSLTPHRDAAQATFGEARRKLDAKPNPDPVKAIGGSMSLATTEAILLGCSDMLDREVPRGIVALHAIRSLAAAWASLTLTVCNGQPDLALGLLDEALADFKVQVTERIHAAPRESIISAPVARSVPWGPAQ